MKRGSESSEWDPQMHCIGSSHPLSPGVDGRMCIFENDCNGVARTLADASLLADHFENAKVDKGGVASMKHMGLVTRHAT
jgi:hypothetical protein